MSSIAMPETTPNSFKISLWVKANTANPMAAVILQNKVTTPILLTIFTNAPCFRNNGSVSLLSKKDVWYLFKK